jgi:hypothetical protein
MARAAVWAVVVVLAAVLLLWAPQEIAGFAGMCRMYGC